MGVGLFILALLATWTDQFTRATGTPSVRLRLAFGRALVALAGLTYLLTELLSFFNALTPFWTRAAWAVVLLPLGYLAGKARSVLRAERAQSGPRLDVFDHRLFFIWAIVLVLPLVLLAVWVPPNNHDAMAYHLARVAHWMQHADIEHYPTVYAHQLSQTPLSEFLILHLHLLSGGDWLSGTVQFGAMIGVLSAVSLLVRHFGGGGRAQVLGVGLAFAIPMGIFQSTSTQNDYLAGFFLLTFLVEGLRIRYPQPNVGVYALLCLALGALTKYTVLIFALPFALWFGWQVLTRNGWLAAIKLASTSLLLLGLALGPHWARNQRTFGHVIGPRSGSALDIPLVNQPIDAVTVYSNTLRNFFNQWGTPLSAWNRAIDEVVQVGHSWMGVPVDAPGRNYLDTVYQTEFGYTEDTAGNLHHILLFSVAGGYLFTRSRAFPGALLLYFGCIVVGFVLFSALLRYQLWHARLLLPLTLAACVPIAMVIGNCYSERARRVLLVVLLLSTLPWVYFNKAKPLIVVENLARRVLNTPHVLIPERTFVALLDRYPAQSGFLKTRYRPNTSQRAYRLRDSVSVPDRRRLITFFDSIDFLKRYSVLATPRAENYLQNKRSLVEPYTAIIDTLARYGISEVGLDLGFDPTEYPLWAMGRARLGDSLRMRYIRYDPLLATTPHAAERFPYRAIVTNFRDLPNRFPAKRVQAYFDYGEVGLLIIKDQ